MEAERRRTQALEARLQESEAAQVTLQRHLYEHQRYAKMLEDELDEKDMLLSQVPYSSMTPESGFFCTRRRQT